ncbi:hypothetical protein IMSHALPRED_009934 [Imshaugia aleurites]|uniref:N-acetyltransferase domain-containing protein n=1 Tax=Imshaugia aleurites TaxID=172621 RepID=A0A8H3EVJ9_9LECA|nr:hypothetical protein IMSHALPRED_009934 [Imshaugia aleurites]
MIPLPQPRSPPERSALHPSLPTSAKPGTNPKHQRSLPAELSITPVSASSLPAYRRLITLLLPIRYPDQFYKDSVANPSPSSLALCASWHETPRPSKRGVDPLTNEVLSAVSAIDGPGTKVIGGIQCRLEPLLGPPPTQSATISTASLPPHQQAHKLYIQTLAVLSPYRHLGIATALLDAIICVVLTQYPRQNVNVKEIYAHVWESNEEALEWYVKRGFEVEEKVVDGYYRKLRPSGARIVRRRIGVGDWVRVAEGLMESAGERVEDVKKVMESGVIGEEGASDG